MPRFDPKTLAACTGGTWTGPVPGPVEGFSVDSRRIAVGQAFVALATERRDGHDFVGQAAASGAAAALVARANPHVELPQLLVPDPLTAFQAIAREHRRSWNGVVVGITGTAGKTSTKEFLAVLLGRGESPGDREVLATEGNLNNHIGVPLTLCRLEPEHHRWAVVEAGISAPGEMAPLAAMIEPDLALVTLVGPAHLEELGGLEGVAREKAVLAEAVRPGGYCIYPSTCAAYAPFRALEAGGRAIVLERAEGFVGQSGPGRQRYSHSHRADTTVVALGGNEYTLRRVSDGMAGNAALAVAAARYLGVSPRQIQERLPFWRPASLRGEWRGRGERRFYVDCYNANPAAMADALDTFCSMAPEGRPRLFIVGCMEELGGESARYHRELGLDLGRRLAARPQDAAVVVGGWAEDVRAGGAQATGRRIDVVEGRDPAAAAAALAERVAGFEGWVFLKGSRRYGLERALPKSC